MQIQTILMILSNYSPYDVFINSCFSGKNIERRQFFFKKHPDKCKGGIYCSSNPDKESFLTENYGSSYIYHLCNKKQFDHYEHLELPKQIQKCLNDQQPVSSPKQ